jgi:hypothetical protein
MVHGLGTTQIGHSRRFSRLILLARSLLDAPAMGPRLWNVVLHFHADGTAALRVSVNARALLPTCEGQSIERALAYADAVLEDVRPEDRLALRAQGTGMLRNFQPTDAKAARAWLHDRARETLGAPACASSATGTRPMIGSEGAPEMDQSIKKSVS